MKFISYASSILLVLLKTCLVYGCGGSDSNPGYESVTQTSQNAQPTYENLKTYMQEEIYVVNQRIKGMQVKFVEVIAPQFAIIANATVSIAKTWENLAWRIAESLDKLDGVLHELQGGIRVLFVIFLLFGCIICQSLLNGIDNTSKPSIRSHVMKGLFYVIQLFCCFCAFGILTDFLFVSVLRVQLDAIHPRMRMFTYAVPILSLLFYYIASLLLAVLCCVLNFVKFILHGPYLLVLAPYVNMYHAYIYRGYHKNQIGAYIVMFSFYAFPLFILGLWQLLTGRQIQNFNDIWDIEFDHFLLYSILFTHVVYCMEALFLQIGYPKPPMNMINRPHQERRY